MKNQTFGVEIETTALGREKAARVIARVLGDGSQVRHVGGTYDEWRVTAPDGRKWSCKSDSSVSGHRWGNSGTDAEVITPILGGTPDRYAQDIDTLGAIIRALREAGAKCDDSCGVHIHIGLGQHTPRTLRNLVNIVYAKEDFLREALGVSEGRWTTWCQPVEPAFLEALNQKKPKDLDDFAMLWYGHVGRYYGDGGDHRLLNTDLYSRAQRIERLEWHKHEHYDDSRYRLLNLHAVWQKGTVEFRAFNGVLHAGKIRAYVLLCLAISDKALKSASARPAKNPSENHAYAFRCWLLQLGFIGDEFAAPRKHLMENVPGNGAWRHGAPTQRATA